ncbi:hypothetical protein P3T36_003349 [Kitasatospora sp. MAP12-15]|uniref:hypothetical protein n=1 Tax=unclassified Kitasatospora TaxID=2633591 RepID=UPI0024738F22|nr:hypothetical protein [Kitasatospora sp. MAP12-44]MDH6111325.1 hypothetical protein [Kitasatospora sp. MAP12-44]
MFARLPNENTPGQSAWAQAPDPASCGILDRAGFVNEGGSRIYTAEGHGTADLFQRIRFAQQMLQDAGYTTRVVPPLPRAHTEPLLRESDWLLLEARLTTAAAQVYNANAQDIGEILGRLTDPQYGLLERVIAVVDTAAQKLANQADRGPAQTLSDRLRDASEQLTQLGHDVAALSEETAATEPDHYPVEPIPADERMTAARSLSTRLGPASPPAPLPGADRPAASAASARQASALRA